MKMLLIIAGTLVLGSAVAVGCLYVAYPVQVSTLGGMGRNFLVTLSAPPGTTTTELNRAYKAEAVAGAESSVLL
jgi:hypothetical protein